MSIAPVRVGCQPLAGAEPPSGENRPQPSIGVESISFRRGRCPQDLLRRRLLDSDLAFHVYHEALPSAGADGAYSPNPTTSSDNYFPLHSGNGPRVLPLRSSQAAGRNELSCLSQAPIWFQLAKIRVTI